MSLFTLVKTNLIISNRETVNAIVSYILYIFMSLLLVGIFLGSSYSKTDQDRISATTVFVSSIFLYDYILTQTKLRTMSLIEKSSYALFPISRIRSLSTRFFLFAADKRILFYLLPMFGMMIVLAIRDKFVEMSSLFLLFALMYLTASELFFLFYSLLKRLANRFSARTISQFSAVPLLLFFLVINMTSHGKMYSLAKVPIASQSTEGIQKILTSQVGSALVEVGYLLGIFVSIALAAFGASLLYEEVTARFRFKLAFPTHKVVQKKIGPQKLNVSETSQTSDHAHKHEPVINETFAEEPTSAAVHSGWHIVLVDWLIHQREEKILYLILLYPVMIIFSIIKIASRIHFDLGSLIFPVFFLTQMLGSYFADNHFTGHGLRLSHIALTPFDAHKFVFAKTVSTWGLLSLMDVFVCLFCGVYLNMAFQTLLQGTIYSIFLPLVLLQSENTLNLYFPEIWRHPLISLLIVIFSELLLTAIYILAMLISPVLGILFVASILYLSLAFSIPAWGKQLSKQLPILLEVRR